MKFRIFKNHPLTIYIYGISLLGKGKKRNYKLNNQIIHENIWYFIKFKIIVLMDKYINIISRNIYRYLYANDFEVK